MFNRHDLKEKGKIRFKLNYWNCVIVSFVLMMMSGSLSTTFSSETSTTVDSGDVSQAVSNVDMSVVYTITGIAVVGTIIYAIIRLCLLNPLRTGCFKFFKENQHDENARINEMGYAFRSNFTNVIMVTFVRDLTILLFSILLIIPGIIKAYELRMVDYILAENPDLDYKEVFAKSKEMMDGNKWQAFVLDLSFFGWYLLGAFTCGILYIFYVMPYVNATKAELYYALKK